MRTEELKDVSRKVFNQLRHIQTYHLDWAVSEILKYREQDSNKLKRNSLSNFISNHNINQTIEQSFQISRVEFENDLLEILSTGVPFRFFDNATL